MISRHLTTDKRAGELPHLSPRPKDSVVQGVTASATERTPPPPPPPPPLPSPSPEHSLSPSVRRELPCRLQISATSPSPPPPQTTKRNGTDKEKGKEIAPKIPLMKSNPVYSSNCWNTLRAHGTPLTIRRLQSPQQESKGLSLGSPHALARPQHAPQDANKWHAITILGRCSSGSPARALAPAPSPAGKGGPSILRRVKGSGHTAGSGAVNTQTAPRHSEALVEGRRRERGYRPLYNPLSTPCGTS
ncbi:formin-like protein 20 [Penaeus japonicus]|uniref:formin-like protein 20 n=1 Tax=Penaeus japonicus TaxID=27405 RepID=UPI001C7101DA|nr:formin-like protein 20 [Penaeus japonicus]